MMQRLLVLLVSLFAACAQAAAPAPPPVAGRAWHLTDLTSGQVLVAEKADEVFEPASLTKLMTAYVVFTALRDKRIALDQNVAVSTRAWKAIGSRMFIEPRRPVSVDELIRGMVVQSGNDACVALAEHVAGTEEAFVERMNATASRLGMARTKYRNASGLPAPDHVSTAQDLSLLAAALIRDFPDEYARYYSQKEFRYNNITQLNRNRLLWLDPNVDGMKTGYTEAAGYCLIASANRNGRRLLSVLLGSSSESVRAQETLKLLNWGYMNFDAVRLYARGASAKTIEVWKGKAKTVNAGFAGDLVVTVPRQQADKLKAELESQRPLVAPIAKGQRVGMLRVTLEGERVGEFPLVALEAVPAAGVVGRAWDTLRLWLK